MPKFKDDVKTSTFGERGSDQPRNQGKQIFGRHFADHASKTTT